MTQLAAECILPSFDNSSSPVDSVGQQLRSFSNGKTLTVALIASRSLTREGLMRLLDGYENLRVIQLSRCSELLGKGPDVLSEVEIVLLNLGWAVIRDPEIVRDITLLNKALPKASVIVISDRDDSYQVGQALLQGIRGYIPTTLTSQILMGALRLVQAGGTFVPANALTEALSQQEIALHTAKAEVAAVDIYKLTLRQQEVLNFLRQGKPNKIIAHELGMRESTVKVHVRQIMRKMRVSNRTEAALLARAFSKQRTQHEPGITHAAVHA